MRLTKYRSVSTTTLRAQIWVLSKMRPRWLFAAQIAEECGGFLVEWVLGVQ